MLVVGLTGSIGMGKTTVAAMLRERGIAVFDADAEVHRLYEGDAVPLVEAAFPGTTKEGRVDRNALAAVLAERPENFPRLEAIVHPLVKRAEAAFLHAERKRGANIAALEIPLLFETGLNEKVDVVVVVSAPADVQRERVLARSGISTERLDTLLARQMPDGEKRRRADFVVDTGGSITASGEQIDRLLPVLKSRPAAAYELYWA